MVWGSGLLPVWWTVLLLPLRRLFLDRLKPGLGFVFKLLLGALAVGVANLLTSSRAL